MVDPDAPSCTNPSKKYYLHWLKINNNDNVMPFVPPTPPKGSGEHRYYIILYEQSHHLDPKLFNNISREKFPATEFAKQNGLETVAAVMFVTESSPNSQCSEISEDSELVQLLKIFSG